LGPSLVNVGALMAIPMGTFFFRLGVYAGGGLE